MLDALRHALNHLYDPEQLRTSPLTALVPDDASFTAPSKLQHILLEAIAALRPAAGEPPGSMRRRIHQVLQLRYEQQFEQKEVAMQLGLSVRQYRRLQQAAIEALALHLYEQFGDAIRASAAPPSAAGGAVQEDGTAGALPGALPESLRWLAALTPGETTDVVRALPEVVRMIEPLAARHGKQVGLAGAAADAERQPLLAAVHPLVFRQALLHVLNRAILHSDVRSLQVAGTGSAGGVTVTVMPAPGGAEGPGAPTAPTGRGSGQEDEQEAMVQHMLHACGATLEVRHSGRGPEATLTFGAGEELLLLAIDDHVESTDLLQRYAEGTRYRVEACHNPSLAVQAVEQQRPVLILLDVMMPEVDGWEVLSRLKQNEATATVPVFVCTVLDQSELALALGADGFLRKPLTRQALLATLEAQVQRQGPAQR